MSEEIKLEELKHDNVIAQMEKSHENKMEQLRYTRESHTTKHRDEMETFRITNAEMNKREDKRYLREKEKQGGFKGGQY